MQWTLLCATPITIKLYAVGVWCAWANHKTEPSFTSDVRGRRRGEFRPITQVPNGISSHIKERSQHRSVYFCTLIRSNELAFSYHIPFWSSHVSEIYPWCIPHTTDKTESLICSQKIRYWHMLANLCCDSIESECTKSVWYCAAIIDLWSSW